MPKSVHVKEADSRGDGWTVPSVAEFFDVAEKKKRRGRPSGSLGIKKRRLLSGPPVLDVAALSAGEGGSGCVPQKRSRSPAPQRDIDLSPPSEEKEKHSSAVTTESNRGKVKTDWSAPENVAKLRAAVEAYDALPEKPKNFQAFADSWGITRVRGADTSALIASL